MKSEKKWGSSSAQLGCLLFYRASKRPGGAEGHEMPLAALLLQHDRDQAGSVFEAEQTVFDAAGQVQEVTSLQGVRLLVGRDFKAAFNALNRDFASHRVRWERLACGQNDAHDFELPGFE